MIRKATINDIKPIMLIIHDAVNLLKTSNVNQWQQGYPNEEAFLHDIEKQTLWVIEKDEKIVGVWNLAMEDDPTYKVIYEGKWLTENTPYMVIHRIAVKKEYYHQGIAQMMFNFSEEEACKHHFKSIRIDTHRLNQPMNSILTKLGYIKCGIIHLGNFCNDDQERVAYEKIIL